MDKLDLKKELREFYTARTERVTAVDVPAGNFPEYRSRVRRSDAGLV